MPPATQAGQKVQSSPESNISITQNAHTETEQPQDPEKQLRGSADLTQKESVYRSLGWLDRLLVLWILLAIIVGIVLGNFVESVGPALQRGKFVGVSVPIGEFPNCTTLLLFSVLTP